MRYRKLSADRDYTFGQGIGNFFVDQVEAPAQAVLTRLLLLRGEWFLDIDDGTAWATRVLGKYTGSTYDPEIQGRIAGTPNVLQIRRYESINNGETRELSVRAEIDTVYGATIVQGVL